jgi:hypothetical protein
MIIKEEIICYVILKILDSILFRPDFMHGSIIQKIEILIV